jgi:thiopeptide-type bacteriocin biosynthesis protein
MPLLPEQWIAPRLPEDADVSEEMRAFLLDVVSDPIVREAIAVSSSSLDATLDKVIAGVPVEPKRLRRAAFAAARYRSRMTHRPTPFGLMAGVTAVRVDDELKVRVGVRHRRHVRADMGWLTNVLRSWEKDPAVLAHLRVVANDLSFVRGDRLVLSYLRDDDDAWGPDDREQTVRHTGAVRRAMAAARGPIRHPDLVATLSEAFPDAGESVVTRMVAELIEREFLLTDLRPPATTADPIEHVLGLLAALRGHTGRDALAGVRDALQAYERTPLGAGRMAWRRATAAMGALHHAEQLIQVDLAMDADIVLPREVTAEIEEAATVAWRIAPPHLVPGNRLAEYRAEFLERYGSGAVVPVKELLDPQTGLGAPSGYLLPPSQRRRPEGNLSPTGRDLLLCSLAQRAAAEGAREIELDDELVERLTRPGADDESPTYTEISFQVLADTEESLRAGHFRLTTAVQNYTKPGAMFGRFLHLLPDLRPAVAEVAHEAVAGDTGAVPAQLESMIVHPRNVNVIQVPQLTDERVRIGVFADRTRPGVHGIDDLAVTADSDRFSLVSLSTGHEVVPLPFNALNQMLTLPNPIRLIVEIGGTETPPWQTWDWGQAEQLPYLPRVRYGRTVLSSARWLPDPRLLDSGTSHAEWSRLFERWRADWSVPGVVDAVNSDHRVRLDLTSSAERSLFRDELLKRPGLVIEEQPAGGEMGAGWAHGHTAEIALPLRPPAPRRRRPVRPVLISRAQATADATVPQAFPPGGEWLYIKIYAAAARHAELLTRHLPALIRRVTPFTDRWFFLRYRDDEPHLRLRFHGDPATLNTHLLPAVHDWAADLAGQGLIRDILLDTYRPEILRYGGPEATEAAERAFHADSVCVLEQLSLRAQGLIDLPLEMLVAANNLDLTCRLHGEGWRDWLLRAYPKGPRHTAFQRHRREALRRLDPEGGWAGLAEIPGGDRLLSSWARRADEVAGYGRLARDLVQAGRLDSETTAFTSMLHLHHNRLAGISTETETSAYAIARGTVQVRLDRDRHLERERQRARPPTT